MERQESERGSWLLAKEKRFADNIRERHKLKAASGGWLIRQRQAAKTIADRVVEMGARKVDSF